MKKRLAGWQQWWRERVTFEQKAGIIALFFGAVLVAGWLAADQLSGASAGVSSSTGAVVETVDKVVTVHDRGKVVTTRVPVVKVVERTRTDTLPGTTVVRTQTVFGTSTVVIPRYVKHVVTVTATEPARTIIETQTVTHLTTTVQWRVITVVEKSKPVTVTVQAP